MANYTLAIIEQALQERFGSNDRRTVSEQVSALIDEIARTHRLLDQMQATGDETTDLVDRIASLKVQ